MIRFFVLALAALWVTFPSVATVNKCIDAAGKVTFTQHNCPEEHALEDVLSARNERPSGSGASLRMAAPAAAAPRSGGQRYTVVGEKPAAKATPAPNQAVQRGDNGVGGTSGRQPQIRYEERLVDCSHTDKKGRRIGCSRMIKVPVAR